MFNYNIVNWVTYFVLVTRNQINFKIMRKLIFILFFVIGCWSYKHQFYSLKPENSIIDHWEVMYQAICKTESEFDHLAYNKKTGAAGIIQITKIFVDDVNRILGINKYKYNDRYNKDKCREMFNIYQDYYNPNKDIHTAILLHYNGPNIKGNKWYLKRVLNNLNYQNKL